MNGYIQALRSRYAAKKFDPERTIFGSDIQAIRTILQLTPSSTNLQPWHFVLASTEQGKARVAKAAEGSYSYNAPKIRNACLTVVLCSKAGIDFDYTTRILEQEDRDGRYPTPEVKEGNRKGREFFTSLHLERGDAPQWLEKQTYIALGNLLVGAQHLGFQACPMEGFDRDVLAEELGLVDKGYVPSVIVAIGYSAEDDFNARAPKSRLPLEEIITEI